LKLEKGVILDQNGYPSQHWLAHSLVNLPKERKREKRAKREEWGHSKMKTLCRVRPKDGGIPKKRGLADL
jgi:hypothetical protein